jgi:outer membrane protein assembly factor BamB
MDARKFQRNGVNMNVKVGLRNVLVGVGRFGLASICIGAGLWSCSSLNNENLAKRDLAIHKNWIRTTNLHANEGFRRMNRMTPVLSDHYIVQGNGIDGLSIFDREYGNVKWHWDVTNGAEAGATMVNDRVFFGGNDGQFYSVSMTSGQTHWTFPTRSETLSTPTLDEGVVYFLAGNNVLYALDAESGKQLWLYSRIDASSLSVRGGARPTIRGGLVYAGFSDGTLVALNKKTGALIWEKQINKNKRFKDIDSSPVIDNDLVFAAGFDSSLYALKAQTGDVIWKFDKGSSNAVTIAGDKLFYATSEGEVLALKKESGQVLWTYKNLHGLATQPVVYNGLVVFGETVGPLVFLNSQSGQKIREFDPGRGITAAPAVDERKNEIYFISNEANLYSLDTSWVHEGDLFPWVTTN